MFDRRLLANFDWALFFNVLAIAVLGVVTIHSASRGYAESSDYWLRQLYWLGLGLVTAFCVLLVDFRSIGRWAYVLHGGVVVALIWLLAVNHGNGGPVNRWFHLGPVAVQPSEFAKFTAVLAIAYYFRDSRRVGDLGVRGILVPALLVLVPFFLIVQQPDLGTALLLAMVFFPLIVLAGVRLRLMLYLAVAAVVAVGLLVAAFRFGYYRIDANVTGYAQTAFGRSELTAAVRALEGRRFFRAAALEQALEAATDGPADDARSARIAERAFRPYISHVLRPYQQRRLVTFLNPDRDPLGAGYHVIQSKVAIGSGQFWGKGYGESTQGSLNFLPARHTDFIFSIFAEEWGFLGALVLMTLYGTFVWRGLTIILQTHDRFSAFLTLGVLSIVVSQVIVSIGMSLGLLPVVGVPLPFFSYGGSAMISMMFGVGLLLNIRMRRFLWT